MFVFTISSPRGAIHLNKSSIVRFSTKKYETGPSYFIRPENAVKNKNKKLNSKTLCFIFFIVDLNVVKILKALTFATRELCNFTN